MPLGLCHNLGAEAAEWRESRLLDRSSGGPLVSLDVKFRLALRLRLRTRVDGFLTTN